MTAPPPATPAPPTPPSATPEDASPIRPASADPTAKNLGGQAVRGSAWTTLLTVGNRLVQVGSQLVLAYLLLESDFGLVGLAYSVAAFAAFIRHAGIGVVLLQRQRRFARWAEPATWLSLAAGLTAGGLLAGAALPASWVYDEPALAGVILVLALAMPFDALMTVPFARLRVDMRFRTVFFLEWGTALAVALTSIGLAFTGWGVYSFVLPKLIVGVLAVPVAWRLARVPPPRHLRLTRWKYILGGSLWVTGGGLLIQVINQGDYAVLGLYLPAEMVGLYYLAFVIATQSMTLVTLNLGGVLMAALSKMRGDLPRQSKALTDALTAIAAIGMPICFTLAAVAEPLVGALLEPRWEPSGELLAWLSLGIAFRLIGHNGNIFLQATGQWRKYLWLNAVNAVAFLTFCWAGVELGGMTGVAIAVSLFYVAYSYGYVAVALPAATPGRWTAPVRVMRDALWTSALAAALAYAATLAFANDWAALIVGGLVSVAANALLMIAFRRAYMLELFGRLAAGLTRRTKPTPSAPAPAPTPRPPHADALR